MNKQLAAEEAAMARIASENPVVALAQLAEHLNDGQYSLVWCVLQSLCCAEHARQLE